MNILKGIAVVNFGFAAAGLGRFRGMDGWPFSTALLDEYAGISSDGEGKKRSGPMPSPVTGVAPETRSRGPHPGLALDDY